MATAVPPGIAVGEFAGQGTYGLDAPYDPGEDSCNCPDDCGTPPSSEVPGATCDDESDNDCDGLTDCHDPDCASVCNGVPTVSAWGFMVSALALLTMARIAYAKRKDPVR